MERYRTRTVEVEAMRLGSPITLEKGVKGRKGDWLIKGPGNHLSVLDDKLFGIRFELVSGAPAEQVTPERRRRGGRRPGPKPGARKGKPGPRAPRAAAAPRIEPIKAGKRMRYTADQMAEARRLIEGGTSIPDAAKKVGAEYTSVYRWAKANGWESKA